MNKNLINVGRVKFRSIALPWWYHCPLCPTLHGFKFYRSQESAWDATERHLFKHHPGINNRKEWMDEMAKRGKLK